MIVVDSSVWIDFLNGRPTSQVDRLHDLLGAEPLLIGDMILLEVLQGVRFEAEAARVEAALRRFDIQPMLDPELAVLAAAHYRTLRNLGVSVRKTVDLVIGTFCIACGHALLTADRDFMPMARHPGTDAGLRDGWRSLRFDAAAPSLRGGEADAAVGRVQRKAGPAARKIRRFVGLRLRLTRPTGHAAPAARDDVLLFSCANPHPSR